MVKSVCIRNYRTFRNFDLELASGINILVGNNDTGKSTLLEAINLALTGRVNGRPLFQELSPYFLNIAATREYVEHLQHANRKLILPPTIIVDVFLEDIDELEILRGTNNLRNDDTCGLRIQAKLSEEFFAEYESFVSKPESVTLVPTEYYKVEWLGFSGNAVTARSLPIAASVVDPTTIRLQSGVDYHLQQILHTYLEPKERVELSRQYRSVREEFSGKESIKTINDRMRKEDSSLTDKTFSLGIDISQRYTWESSLVAHLDDLPFQFAGKGDQSAMKTLLALGRQAERASVILIEEPENHLSYTFLRKLLKRIEERCAGKQVIIATHSAFVLNKLGLKNLVLLGDGAATRITDVPEKTVDYFKRLPGFDTLRLVLSRGAILVEGPSDELIIQRGYLDQKGNLPIEDGIDVISVGLSHKRFLDLAVRLKRRVWIVTDNDGKTHDEVKQRFSEYLIDGLVSLHVGKDPKIPTLEPQIVAANSLATLNAALGKEYCSKEKACEAMLNDKTGSALAIFESEAKIVMPEYIQDVFDQL